MSKPFASLSLDLDNKWSYQKTHGDAGWESFPSYLDIVCPRVVEFMRVRDQKLTFFVVGQDAALDKNRDALALLAQSGHEIGNHSFHHEPWLHRYTEKDIRDELQRAEDCIAHVTGQRPAGFRGPGFSVSPIVLKVLDEMGYVYDASTFPTFLGPVARAYYFMTADLTSEDAELREQLFGKFSDGFGRLRPYRLEHETDLIEIPVTTMPFAKVPIHLSYVLYLGAFSAALAKTYFRFAMSVCRAARVEPSLLLHPLDFLGPEDVSGLEFFPGMKLPLNRKLELTGWAIDEYCSRFEVGTMMDHALRQGGNHKRATARNGTDEKRGLGDKKRRLDVETTPIAGGASTLC